MGVKSGLRSLFSAAPLVLVFEVCFLLEVGSESRVRPRAESCCAGGSD